MRFMHIHSHVYTHRPFLLLWIIKKQIFQQKFLGKKIKVRLNYFLFPSSEFKSLSCFLAVIQSVLTTSTQCIHTAIWTDCFSVCVYRLVSFIQLCCLLKRCRTGGIRARKTHTHKRARTNKPHNFLSYFTHKLCISFHSPSLAHRHTHTYKQSLVLPKQPACVFFIIHLNIYKSDLRPY